MFSNILKSRIKVMTCFCLTFCLSLFALSGCDHKGEAVAQYDNYKMEAGEYNVILIQEIFDAQSQLVTSFGATSQPSDPSKMISEGTIEDKPAIDYIKEQSTKWIKILLFARAECDKLGISLSEEEENTIKDSIEKSYDQIDKLYNVSKFGISKESFIQFEEDSKRLNLLCGELFGEGKSKAIPNEEIDKYTKEHGVKYKVVSIDKPLTENDESVAKTLKNEGVQNIKALVDKYMSQIAANKSIDDINAAYNKASEKPEAALEYTFQYDDQDFEEKELVLSIKSNSPATLKEDDDAYYIIQRFDVDKESIEKERNSSRSILTSKAVKEYFDDIVEKSDIKINQSAIDSHNPVDMASALQQKRSTEKSSSSDNDNEE